jgi:DNA-binding Xre family transcriptional regulator
VSPARRATNKVGYRWHLRMRMAERGMYKTSDLVPLLTERGVVLSREQVYRLVAKVPERLSLAVLAALCDVLDCSPGDLIEPVPADTKPPAATTSSRAAVREIRPTHARVVRPTKR